MGRDENHRPILRPPGEVSASIASYLVLAKWSFEFHPYLMNWSNLAHFWMAPTVPPVISSEPSHQPSALRFWSRVPRQNRHLATFVEGLKDSDLFMWEGEPKNYPSVWQGTYFWGELIFLMSFFWKRIQGPARCVACQISGPRMVGETGHSFPNLGWMSYDFFWCDSFRQIWCFNKPIMVSASVTGFSINYKPKNKTVIHSDWKYVWCVRLLLMKTSRA